MSPPALGDMAASDPAHEEPAAEDLGGATAPPAPPPEVRAAAEQVFGSGLARVEEYAWLLTTDGVVRGLLGPREAPRLWDRHLLNCAVVAERVPTGAAVTDVGSGAGLPGVVLALARPDLSVVLVDAMVRRTDFLAEVVAALDLTDRVTVVRGRAEDLAGSLPPAPVTTARALASLDRLAAWCLPLTTLGGVVLAFKGDRAPAEVAAHTDAVRRMGGGTPSVHQCGVGLVTPPATVVEFVRERRVGPAGQRRGRASRGRRS